MNQMKGALGCDVVGRTIKVRASHGNIAEPDSTLQYAKHPCELRVIVQVDLPMTKAERNEGWPENTNNGDVVDLGPGGKPRLQASVVRPFLGNHDNWILIAGTASSWNSSHRRESRDRSSNPCVPGFEWPRGGKNRPSRHQNGNDERRSGSSSRIADHHRYPLIPRSSPILRNPVRRTPRLSGESRGSVPHHRRVPRNLPSIGRR